MKVIASIVALLLLLGGALYLFVESTIEDDVLQLPIKDSEETVLKPETIQNDTARNDVQSIKNAEETELLLGEMTEEQKQSELILVKSEIDTLMQRYERNLSNPEQREAIKQELEVLMARYDQLVLQDAINKMKESNG